MVESLKELNNICQKPRYKEVGNWMVRNILRDAALPITWALLHTPVTANQVTLASLGIGLFGILLMAFVGKGWFLLGALLLQAWYLLDHVDGQIARYRKTACLTGRFFDFLTHHLIHGVIFFFLGFYAFRAGYSSFFIVWGFVASVSMMTFNLLNDTKYKTFFEKIMTLKSVEIISDENAAASADEGQCQAVPETSLARRAFSWCHKISEIHVLMNIITLAAFFQVFAGHAPDFRFLLLIIYGFVAPAIAGVKASYLIINRKIDDEFERTFK